MSSSSLTISSTIYVQVYACIRMYKYVHVYIYIRTCTQLHYRQIRRSHYCPFTHTSTTYKSLGTYTCVGTFIACKWSTMDSVWVQCRYYINGPNQTAHVSCILGTNCISSVYNFLYHYCLVVAKWGAVFSDSDS